MGRGTSGPLPRRERAERLGQRLTIWGDVLVGHVFAVYFLERQ